MPWRERAEGAGGCEKSSARACFTSACVKRRAPVQSRRGRISPRLSQRRTVAVETPIALANSEIRMRIVPFVACRFPLRKWAV